MQVAFFLKIDAAIQKEFRFVSIFNLMSLWHQGERKGNAKNIGYGSRDINPIIHISTWPTFISRDRVSKRME